MNNIIVDKTYLVEVPLPATNTNQTIYFPTLNNLDGKLTQGISTYSIQSLLKSPTNAALVSDNILRSSYVTLFQGDVQQIWQIPMVELVTVNNGGVTQARNPFAIEFDNLRIIWAKSYIFIGDSALLPASASSFVFNIKYIDDPTGGNK